jgi:integrase
MPSKIKRTKVEPNIWRRPSGVYEARLTVTGRPPVLETFPPDTSIKEIRQWIADKRSELEKDCRLFGRLTRQAQAQATGTLEGDASRYLNQIAGREGSKADGSHLRAWFDVEVVVDHVRVRLGGLARADWTAEHVNLAIAAWQKKPSPHAIRKVVVRASQRDAHTIGTHRIAATTVKAHDRTGHACATVRGYERQGSVITEHARAAHTIRRYERTAPATSGHIVATKTIRHRCRVLAHLFHTLDGPKAPTPVDDARVPKHSQTPPVTVSAEVIAKTLEKLVALDEKMFARFYLHAVTAQRPCQIERAQPGDVLLGDERSWLVRNAKGEPAHTFALNDHHVRAWEYFIKVDAWGTFDRSEYGKVIHKAGWPKGVRPYSARHSLAVDAIRRGVSLGDVQAMLGHTQIQTTRTFYAPFQVDRQRVVSEQMAPYLADVLKPRLVGKK